MFANIYATKNTLSLPNRNKTSLIHLQDKKKYAPHKLQIAYIAQLFQAKQQIASNGAAHTA